MCFIFSPHKSQWLETEVYSCSKWRLNIFYQSQTKCTERENKVNFIKESVFFLSNFAHLSLKTHTQISLPHQGQSKQTRLNKNHIQLTRIAFSPIVNVNLIR